MREFNVNGRFYAVVKDKWEKIIKSNSKYSTRYYISYYDKLGNNKIRTLYIVKKVFSDHVFFLVILYSIFNRNIALRGQTEPTSLQ